MNKEYEEIEQSLRKISLNILPDKARLFSIFDEIKTLEIAETIESEKRNTKQLTELEMLLKKSQDFITSLNPAWKYTAAFAVILIFAIPFTVNKLTGSSTYISKNTAIIFDTGSSSEVSQDDIKILANFTIPNDIYKDETN